jgi:histidinol-phosphate aminotransferase
VTGNYQGVGEQTLQATATQQSFVPNTQFVNLPAASINGAVPASVGISLFSANANRFLNLELSALEADGKGKIISSPRVVTADQQPAVIEQMLKVKDSYNCDALSIAAATAAIDDQAWLADNRATIIATRTRLIHAMRAMGFEAGDSQANFVWCTHPERPHRPFYEALKAQGILIRYMNYAGWGDGLRITVGTDDEIDAFLAVMKTL